MRPMTTETPEPERQAPGERRLARPPSERYRTAEPAPEELQASGGSIGRALAFGVLAAIALGLVIAVLGGVVLVTAGLIAVAALGGWAVAVAVRAGASGALPPMRRAAVAAVLAAIGVLGGQLALWLFARYEGGVLGPIDYLAETFGLLVPLELGLGVAAAWLASR
jgi:hypothetical protein